jgi:amino acid transporter
MFAFYWIILVSNTGTCITFAQYTLQLANPNAPASDVDQRSLRFIAIIVITVATLLLYFVRRLCFFANNIFAVFKIILTLIIFGVGIRLSQRPNSGLVDFNEKQDGASVYGSLTAMIYILYSYQGWEHTTYVSIS